MKHSLKILIIMGAMLQGTSVFSVSPYEVIFLPKNVDAHYTVHRVGAAGGPDCVRTGSTNTCVGTTANDFIGMVMSLSDGHYSCTLKVEKVAPPLERRLIVVSGTCPGGVSDNKGFVQEPGQPITVHLP